MAQPSPRPNEEIIEAQVRSVTFKSVRDQFAIFSMDRLDQREAITAVGPLAEYQRGDRLHLVGRFETHGRYGLQFRVQFAFPIPPQGVDAIREYLVNAKIKGVGAKRVDQIIEAFGEDTLKVITDQPERLEELEGLGTARITRIRESVRDQKDRQETMIFLYELKLSAIFAARIWAQYMENTRSIIEENPYRLIEEIDHVDFFLADQIAQRLGWAPDRLERIGAALTHWLGSALDEGHVCAPAEQVLLRTARSVGCSSQRCREALAIQHDVGAITTNPIAPDYLYLSEYDQLESEAARAVSRLFSMTVNPLRYEIEELEEQSGLTLASAQREAISAASKRGLLLLTGGPGTGKTTTVRTLIALFQSHNLKILLSAPTGRAARRLSETTGQEAMTIHRLLDYQPQEEIFRRGVEEPLEADVVLVDEASMIDLKLFVALLRALPRGCRLVLVGDADQLPSVGAGRVYADLLSIDGLPTVTLTQIFRQAEQSQIILNAHQILHGAPLLLPPPSDDENASLPDFFNIPARDGEHAASLIEQLVTQRIPDRFKIHSREIQIITPMYRGHCGADRLNLNIQALLNPSGRPVHSSSPLRVGDRVMQLKNFYDKDVFNGDTGVIITRHEEGAVVDFDGRVVNYQKEHLSMLSLAYACSIHKSQGSEYPAVIIPVLEEHWSMLQRDLLYTAVTRGQKLVILLSMPAALQKALTTQKSDQRYSFLNQRVSQQLAHPPENP